MGLAVQTTPPRRFAAGRVGFAVGDIHGRSDLLGRLLDALEEEGARLRADTGAEPVVIFLGDYVDRGRDSRGVVEALLTRPVGFERRFLMGNHEQVMGAFLADPLSQRGWLFHGGVDTLASYGVRPCLAAAPDPELIAAAEALRLAMPESHHTFLAQLEPYAVYGDYLFVHAGVDPDKPLDAQTPRDLFWIRNKFLTNAEPYALKVVHGHTPVERPYLDARRIAVDTGAYATGVLSAVRLDGAKAAFLAATSRGVRAL